MVYVALLNSSTYITLPCGECVVIKIVLHPEVGVFLFGMRRIGWLQLHSTPAALLR